MKLVLYSGGQERSNHFLHRALIGLTGKSRSKRMTYIPFCADGAGLFFHRFSRRYRAYGGTEFHCLPVDQEMSERAIQKALNGDVIYLAGGNTYYFLKHLQESGLLPRLRKYAREGGVLAGLSAGALILTPCIRLAGIPKLNADENEVKLKDLRALNLTHFEFSPHFTGHPPSERELELYSRKLDYPIYACKDGGGIVVDESLHRFEAFGQVYVFHQGRKYGLAR